MSAPDSWRMSSEDAPRAATDPQIDTPSLNIFLGSTPSYAALEAMRRLVYLPESDRRKVALVFLDIDSPPAEVLQFRQEHLGQLREFDLRISVAHGVLYADQLDPEVAAHTYIPTKIPESFDNGAGGIRNNGHVAACADHDKIVQALDEALASIGALPMDRGARPVTEVAVNIVAFLGGGTGSGILPDIAVMARHRILQLNLKHRLNIFCLLPEHVREATTNDVSWRKSNATATVMELVALSLVRGRSDSAPGPYLHYMLHTPYEVRGTTIANEVFLFGRTSMTSAEDAARIVGLDLYMRITNASGVGFLERSKAVDRRTLGNYDSNGLPTMFGTSCPMEVAFPAVDTATAFARLTASKTLPLLARDLGAATTQLSGSDLEEVKEWDSAIKPEEPPPFTEKSFMTAGRDRLDLLEARLNKRVDEAAQEIAELVDEKEVAEKRKIYGAGMESLGAQIVRLQRRKRIYADALSRAQDQSTPSKARPDRLLQRSMLRPWPIPGDKERRVNAVVDDFNRVQRRNIRAAYLKQKKALLIRLLDYVEAELKNVKRFQGDIDLEQTARDLERAATSSAAWRGQLDHGHVHTRHIFDLPGVPGMNDADGLASPPVQRLYEYLTTRDTESYAQRFIEWLEKTHGADATLASGGGSEMRDRLVQYLRDEVYLKPLLEMNLFDLLDRCCVLQGERPDRKTEDLLLGHLQHISGLAREMVAFEAQLWNEGGGMLNTSLYLGMSWRTGAQRGLLERARSRLGAIAKEGASPMVASAVDPHRLQLAYGQHAISIGTIPDFYQENNSAIGEFSRHQTAWYDPTNQRPYGQSRAPVFSSGEMERLVMDPTALGDRVAPGRPMRDLPSRIIRKPQQGAGNAPLWASNLRPVADPAAANGHAVHARADGGNGAAGYPAEGYYGPRSS
ncbi:MAG TPA: tubulin-like doman-containing protein [Ktedonobacterales bacterium]